MKTKQLRLIAYVGLFAVALGMSPPCFASDSASGIRGRAFATLISRVANRVFPVQADIKVYSGRTRRLITTVRSDAAGEFTVLLKPGIYTLVPQRAQVELRPQIGDSPPIILPATAEPLQVHVVRHQFVQATVRYNFTSN